MAMKFGGKLYQKFKKINTFNKEVQVNQFLGSRKSEEICQLNVYK